MEIPRKERQRNQGTRKGKKENRLLKIVGVNAPQDCCDAKRQQYHIKHKFSALLGKHVGQERQRSGGEHHVHPRQEASHIVAYAVPFAAEKEGENGLRKKESHCKQRQSHKVDINNKTANIGCNGLVAVHFFGGADKEQFFEGGVENVDGAKSKCERQRVEPHFGFAKIECQPQKWHVVVKTVEKFLGHGAEVEVAVFASRGFDFSGMYVFGQIELFEAHKVINVACHFSHHGAQREPHMMKQRRECRQNFDYHSRCGGNHLGKRYGTEFAKPIEEKSVDARGAAKEHHKGYEQRHFELHTAQGPLCGGRNEVEQQQKREQHQRNDGVEAQGKARNGGRLAVGVGNHNGKFVFASA